MPLGNVRDRIISECLPKHRILTTLFQFRRPKSSGMVLKNPILPGLRRLFQKVSPTKRTFIDRSPDLALLRMTTGGIFPDPDVLCPQAKVAVVAGG